MINKINICIYGSKSFDNYPFFEEKLYKILSPYLENNYIIHIKEGENTTTDNFAVRFCNENNLILQRIKLNWQEDGKSAAYTQLKKLVWGENMMNNEATDILIIFYSHRDKEEKEKMLFELLSLYNDLITDREGNVSEEPEYYFFED